MSISAPARFWARAAGFWPYNHSNRVKTFLGDSGSTLLALLSPRCVWETGYSEHSNLGFLAPLLILAIPLFDTAFVCLMRISKGKNPLCGSNDHAALRLMKVGLSKNETLLLFTARAYLPIFSLLPSPKSARWRPRRCILWPRCCWAYRPCSFRAYA